MGEAIGRFYAQMCEGESGNWPPPEAHLQKILLFPSLPSRSQVALGNALIPAVELPPLRERSEPLFSTVELSSWRDCEVQLRGQLRSQVQLGNEKKPALFVLEIDMVGARFEHRAQKERIGGRRGGSHRQILRPNARSAPAKDFPEFLIRMGHNPDVFFLSSLPCEPLSLR